MGTSPGHTMWTTFLSLLFGYFLTSDLFKKWEIYLQPSLPKTKKKSKLGPLFMCFFGTWYFQRRRQRRPPGPLGQMVKTLLWKPTTQTSSQQKVSQPEKKSLKIAAWSTNVPNLVNILHFFYCCPMFLMQIYSPHRGKT